MLFSFGRPIIKDTTDLRPISLNPEKSSFMSECHILRQNFIKMYNEQLQSTPQHSESQKAHLYDYLKKQIDWFLTICQYDHQKFKYVYDSFFSKKEITDDSKNDQVTCSFEVIFTRYMYAFYYQKEASNLYNKFHETLTASFEPHFKLGNQDEQIDKAIESLRLGLYPLALLRDNLWLLLPSFVSPIAKIPQEFRPNVINLISQIMEVSILSLSAEIMRLKINHKTLARLTKCAKAKMDEVQAIITLENIKNPELEYFVQFGCIFFEIYTYYAIYSNYNKIFKDESYERKEYTELTKKIFVLSQKIIYLVEKIPKGKQQTTFQKYADLIIQNAHKDAAQQLFQFSSISVFEYDNELKQVIHAEHFYEDVEVIDKPTQQQIFYIEPPKVSDYQKKQ